MSLEAENLNRWRESRESQRWVKAHQGEWTHADWLALLDTLRQSPYWPMHEAEIGRVLEALKARWHRLQASRERIHQPLNQEEDAELERAARAEVRAMLGQSVPIQATTLAEAFAEAKRLRESQNVLVAQNSLWAWFCALPVEKQAAIGTFEGKYAKVRLYAAVRARLSRG